MKEFDKNESHTFIFNEKTCSFREVFEKYASENGIKSKNQIETMNIEIIKNYISRNLGISILPSYIVEEEVKNGTLKAIPIEPHEPHIIHIVYNKNRTMPLAIKKFLDLVDEKFVV